MLKVENIKNGFDLTGNKPCILWEGNGDALYHNKNYRIVLSKQNTLVIEYLFAYDAMGQQIWNKANNHQEIEEILSKAFLDALKKNEIINKDMKKIFKVHIDTFIIVYSDDKDNEIRSIAHRGARQHIADIIDTSDISYEELTSVKDLPKHWTHHCLPYGNTSNLSIGELLNYE